MIDFNHTTPISYAKALAYLPDPSTIRARVAQQFGSARAPSIDQCRNLRAAYLESRKPSGARCQERFGRNFKCDHPQTEANTIIDIRGNDRCAQCEADRIEAKRKREADELEALKALAKRREEEERVRNEILARHRAELADLAQTSKIDSMKLHTHLISDIAARFGLTLSDIRGGQRNRIYVDARAVVAMALRARGNSYPMCAKYMGLQCHSSVIHLCETFPQRSARNPKLAEVLKDAGQ